MFYDFCRHKKNQQQLLTQTRIEYKNSLNRGIRIELITQHLNNIVKLNLVKEWPCKFFLWLIGFNSQFINF